MADEVQGAYGLLSDSPLCCDPPHSRSLVLPFIRAKCGTRRYAAMASMASPLSITRLRLLNLIFAGIGAASLRE